MGTPTGLHPYQTRRQAGKKRAYLRTLQLPLHNRMAPLIDAVHLKYVFCQVEPNSRNLHNGRSYFRSVDANSSTLAHRCRLGDGSDHPIKFGDALKYASDASDPGPRQPRNT